MKFLVKQKNLKVIIVFSQRFLFIAKAKNVSPLNHEKEEVFRWRHK